MIDPGPDLRLVGEFLLIALLVELTPGPNMGWLAASAARDGRRAGFAAVAGVTLGLALLALAAGLGIGSLLERDHRLAHALDWAGAAVMALLTGEAVGQLRANRGAPAAPATAGGAFQRGLFTNLFNAKALAFLATVPPRFLRAGAATGAGLSLLLTGYLIVAILVHAAIVLLAARLGGAAPRRALAAASALGLAAVTAWLVWKAANAP